MKKLMKYKCIAKSYSHPMSLPGDEGEWCKSEDIEAMFHCYHSNMLDDGENCRRICPDCGYMHHISITKTVNETIANLDQYFGLPKTDCEVPTPPVKPPDNYGTRILKEMLEKVRAMTVEEYNDLISETAKVKGVPWYWVDENGEVK